MQRKNKQFVDREGLYFFITVQRQFALTHPLSVSITLQTLSRLEIPRCVSRPVLAKRFCLFRCAQRVLDDPGAVDAMFVKISLCLLLALTSIIQLALFCPAFPLKPVHLLLFLDVFLADDEDWWNIPAAYRKHALLDEVSVEDPYMKCRLRYWLPKKPQTTHALLIDAGLG